MFFVLFLNSVEMAEKVEDDGNHVIGWIWRLRDKTLDYTSLITHFEDEGEEGESGKNMGGKQEKEDSVRENNYQQRGVESLLYVLHQSAFVNRGQRHKQCTVLSPHLLSPITGGPPFLWVLTRR